MSKLFYDKRRMYSLAEFHTHDLQAIMALFLLNPALYADHRTCRDKQGYFFDRFRVFAEDYYNLDSSKELDASVYFMSAAKDRAGEANICGGGGRMSNSAKKEFKDRYHRIESRRAELIDYFQAKYRVKLEPGTDSRLFVGVSEIWNKLDQATEIVAASQWSNVASISYSDDTFASPIPSGLDKRLVPCSIRNRTWQKYMNSKPSSSYRPRSVSEIERAEAEELAREASAASAATALPKPEVLDDTPKIAFVIPPELLDEDW